MFKICISFIRYGCKKLENTIKSSLKFKEGKLGEFRGYGVYSDGVSNTNVFFNKILNDIEIFFVSRLDT